MHVVKARYESTKGIPYLFEYKAVTNYKAKVQFGEPRNRHMCVCIYILSCEYKAVYDFETTDFEKENLALYSSKYSIWTVRICIPEHSSISTLQQTPH